MKHYRHSEYLWNILPCICYSIICGLITGGVIFLFKFGAKKAEAASLWIYETAKEKPLWIALTFVALIGFALLMALLHKKIAEVKGGGIPRSEGVLRGMLRFRWLPTFLGTFFGSMVSFFCGVPVGSEGPAVLIGTALGSMTGKVSRHHGALNRYVMTGGAGAGFAVATGAPLSGVLFALEEIHKRFTPMLVLSVSMSVLGATYVNSLLCEQFDMNTNLFDLPALGAFNLSDVGYLLLLGLIIAVAVGIFDFSITLFGRFSKRFKRFLSAPVKLIIFFVIVGIFGFTFHEAIYSGHHTILEAITDHPTVLFLATLLVIRLIMMLFVTDSGATGGIFIPTLAVGALAAALAAKLLTAIGMSQELYAITVLLGMCAFIGGTLRAPLTAAVLFVELTGQFTGLFFVALVIFTVNLITEALHLTPFYDQALDHMLEAQNEGQTLTLAYFEMKVSQGAFVVGKPVRDILWPASSVVISVTHAHNQSLGTDNDGEKHLYVGDTVVLRSRYFDKDKEDVCKQLESLVGKEHEITVTTYRPHHEH
ncbi:MAG: chloride channel protein, partial [Clostridia bacterium]|nr:chloride channel protein [Clostridia bacterium]